MQAEEPPPPGSTWKVNVFSGPYKRLQALDLGTRERLGHADWVETACQEKLQWWRVRYGKPGKSGSHGDAPPRKWMAQKKVRGGQLADYAFLGLCLPRV